jgi:hypothetical protein
VNQVLEFNAFGQKINATGVFLYSLCSPFYTLGNYFYAGYVDKLLYNEMQIYIA